MSYTLIIGVILCLLLLLGLFYFFRERRNKIRQEQEEHNCQQPDCDDNIIDAETGQQLNSSQATVTSAASLESYRQNSAPRVEETTINNARDSQSKTRAPHLGKNISSVISALDKDISDANLAMILSSLSRNMAGGKALAPAHTYQPDSVHKGNETLTSLNHLVDRMNTSDDKCSTISRWIDANPDDAAKMSPEQVRTILSNVNSTYEQPPAASILTSALARANNLTCDHILEAFRACPNQKADIAEVMAPDVIDPENQNLILDELHKYERNAIIRCFPPTGNTKSQSNGSNNGQKRSSYQYGDQLKQRSSRSVSICNDQGSDYHGRRNSSTRHGIRGQKSSRSFYASNDDEESDGGFNEHDRRETENRHGAEKNYSRSLRSVRYSDESHVNQLSDEQESYDEFIEDDRRKTATHNRNNNKKSGRSRSTRSSSLRPPNHDEESYGEVIEDGRIKASTRSGGRIRNKSSRSRRSLDMSPVHSSNDDQESYMEDDRRKAVNHYGNSKQSQRKQSSRRLSHVDLSSNHQEIYGESSRSKRSISISHVGSSRDIRESSIENIEDERKIADNRLGGLSRKKSSRSQRSLTASHMMDASDEGEGRYSEVIEDDNRGKKSSRKKSFESKRYQSAPSEYESTDGKKNYDEIVEDDRRESATRSDRLGRKKSSNSQRSLNISPIDASIDDQGSYGEGIEEDRRETVTPYESSKKHSSRSKYSSKQCSRSVPSVDGFSYDEESNLEIVKDDRGDYVTREGGLVREKSSRSQRPVSVSLRDDAIHSKKRYGEGIEDDKRKNGNSIEKKSRKKSVIAQESLSDPPMDVLDDFQKSNLEIVKRENRKAAKKHKLKKKSSRSHTSRIDAPIRDQRIDDEIIDDYDRQPVAELNHRVGKKSTKGRKPLNGLPVDSSEDDQEIYDKVKGDDKRISQHRGRVRKTRSTKTMGSNIATEEAFSRSRSSTGSLKPQRIVAQNKKAEQDEMEAAAAAAALSRFIREKQTVFSANETNSEVSKEYERRARRKKPGRKKV